MDTNTETSKRTTVPPPRSKPQPRRQQILWLPTTFRSSSPPLPRRGDKECRSHRRHELRVDDCNYNQPKIYRAMLIKTVDRVPAGGFPAAVFPLYIFRLLSTCLVPMYHTHLLRAVHHHTHTRTTPPPPPSNIAVSLGFDYSIYKVTSVRCFLHRAIPITACPLEGRCGSSKNTACSPYEPHLRRPTHPMHGPQPPYMYAVLPTGKKAESSP